MFQRGGKFLLTSGLLFHSFSSICEVNKDDKENKEKNINENIYEKYLEISSNINLEELGKSVYYSIDNGVPGKVGYGFLMGYSSGFCLKKVSKVIAFSVGGVFIILQILSSQGYLTINHDRIGKEIENILDVNKDGKIDSKDAEAAFLKLNEVLSYNIPTGGGFTAGLLMGLRN